MLSRYIFLLSVVGVILFRALLADAAEPDRRPNVILVITDDK